MFKSGFVSIIGRPNAGKSTLLNALLNQKVSIVTNKPQTTRNQIRGIYSRDDIQIVFIDTPGIHKPNHKLGETLNKQAFGSTKDVEAIILIVEVSQEIGGGDKFLLKALQNNKTPRVLILNKIDLISKEELIKKTIMWSELFSFDEIIPVSSLKKENTEKVVGVLEKFIPQGPQYYPKDMIVDYPERFIISEIVREKIINKTKEEVPHSVAVLVYDMKKKKNHFHILIDIIVERDSQKGIIIGKKGQMIKDIGIEAREEIEKLLNIKVMLELFVKVEKNWRDEIKFLKEFGYKEK